MLVILVTMTIGLGGCEAGDTCKTDDDCTREIGGLLHPGQCGRFNRSNVNRICSNSPQAF